MIEYPTTDTARIAMRRASEERARVFRELFGGLFAWRRAFAFRARRFQPLRHA
ncbi:hypothetical protein [Jhaorihella thermophila]|uniref:Uncharacterized protein n=1 Tax=Jhaorihella thermophila TaxID=488547 RepID=A0A1H5YAC8_9RHOB|nr:hypothetical protein [Jhaorihella thermophila]SEG21049.1 hypothetical protein SAMN05421751_11636 [Jhaorihella thermophila]